MKRLYFDIDKENNKVILDSKDLITQIDYYTKVYKIYKDRIDKAIEYLDDLQNNIFDGERGNKVRKIIGILKGSDKE